MWKRILEFLLKLLNKEIKLPTEVITPPPVEEKPKEEPVVEQPKKKLKCKTSREGLAFLTCREGVGLSKYKCSAGVWTIGIGATSSEIPNISKWSPTKTITLEEAFILLQSSILKYERAVDKALEGKKIPQHQYDALVSICYNIGTGGLSRSTFMKRIRNGESTSRIVDAIMMWKKPKEIIGRRRKEADLFAKGIYGNLHAASLFPVNPKTGNPQYNRAKIIDPMKYL